MRIILLSDVHANLPALQALVAELEPLDYDLLVHLGDAIAIGPHPRECLDLLLGLEKIRFVIGNHDDWFAHGLPQPRPAWMTDGELEHQYWTHAQLNTGFREVVQSWPWIIHQNVDGVELAFLHYALGKDVRSFKGFLREPTPEALDELFDLPADYVFYGHTHVPSTLRGRASYITPGSFGCQKTAVAPYLVVGIVNGRVDVQYQSIRYDDRPLVEAFEARQVPERAFIYKAFFGGRFPTDQPLIPSSPS